MAILGVSSRIFSSSKPQKVPFGLFELNYRKTPVKFEEKNIKEIRERLKKYESLSAHAGAQMLFHKNKIIAAREEAIILAELETSSKLGIDKYVIHFPSYNAKNAIGRFKRIAQFARKKRIQLLLENNKENIYGNPKQMIPILKKYKLKCNIDIGHVHIQCKTAKKMIKFIEELAPYAKYCHLHDNEGDYDSHLAMGKGKIDWNQIVPVLKKSNIEYFVFENNTLEDAIASRKIFEKIK